jgi:hypothetical protein
MIAMLSRCVMALAIAGLGDRNHEWGLAMQGEFEASIDDGRPLFFAFGCLLGAWRMRLANPDGRFALASYALAVGLILPLASVLAVGAIVGFPYLDFAQDNVVGILAIDGAPTTLLNDGNRAAASSLSMVVLLLAGTSVLIAWAILDQNWVCVAAVERLTVAATLTLLVFVGLLGFDETRMVLPILGFVAQHVVVLMLMRWHWRLDRDTASSHRQD